MSELYVRTINRVTTKFASRFDHCRANSNLPNVGPTSVGKAVHEVPNYLYEAGTTCVPPASRQCVSGVDPRYTDRK